MLIKNELEILNFNISVTKKELLNAIYDNKIVSNEQN